MKFERPTYNTDPTYWAAIATSDGYLKVKFFLFICLPALKLEPRTF